MSRIFCSRLATTSLLLLLRLLHLTSLYNTNLEGLSLPWPWWSFPPSSWPLITTPSSKICSPSPELKSFCHQVLATEEDIDRKCTASWLQFKLLLVEALYDVAVKLEAHIMLTITMQIIFQLAEVMGDIIIAGIIIDWLGRLVKETHAKNLCNRSIHWVRRWWRLTNISIW